MAKKPKTTNRAPSRAKRGKDISLWLVKLGKADFWAEELRQASDDLMWLREDARRMAKTPNAQGMAALHRTIQKARKEMDAALDEVPDDITGATPDEILHLLEQNANQWPDQVLERAMKVYAERHHGRLLLISDGGDRAELDLDTGAWKAADGGT